jgi:hypothetical protein
MGNYVTKSTNIWTGVVEDTKDPLNLGRCKVRVFGVHSDNLREVPTSTLPWATPIYSPNTGKTFSTLVEGDYVIGYFQDGEGSQVPVILGITPGILAQAYNKAKGFSPQSKDPIKTDLPTGQSHGPVTTPPSARSDIANTAIYYTNKVTDHACDFRYQINLDVGLGTFINPVTAIQDAIKAGKNRAAMQMRLLVGVLADNLRKAVNAIIAVLGLDKTGVLSMSYSVAKDIFRKINEMTMKVAEVVEMAAYYTSLVKEIQQIIDYLKSLPSRVLAMVQDCIFGFVNSIKNFVTQVKAIPGAVQSSAENIFSQLSSSANETLNLVTQSATANPVPASLSTLISNPSAASANLANTYLSTFANTETTLANSTANSYNKSKTQSP